MIPVDELMYEIDLRLNKISTEANQFIPDENKILAVRVAQIELIKRKVDPEELRGVGFESSRRRYQDLQFLIENYEDHKLTLTLSDPRLNKYIVSLEDISPDFMFYIDSYMIADKGNCKGRVLRCNTDLIKHSDITLLLNNTNYKPSFEYQETIADISSDELHYYTDGTFTPVNVYLSYMRYPKPISTEGFIELDGSTSDKQDCELEYYLKDDLLDLTCMSLGFYTENKAAIEAATTAITLK